jgi:hypothetical protein
VDEKRVIGKVTAVLKQRVKFPKYRETVEIPSDRLKFTCPDYRQFVQVDRMVTVVPGREAIIGMRLAGAILTFHWKFESLTDDRTRITQPFILSGARQSVHF